MGMEDKLFQMVIFTRGDIQMGSLMAKENTFGKMAQYLRDNLSKVLDKEKA